jgi:hypothetical protein
VLLPRRLSWLQFVAALIGLGMFVAGSVALFTIDNSAGSLFLVALGATLILVALLGERVQLESFEILGAKLRVREVIASRLELAQLASPGEDDRPHAEVHEQALTLQKLVGLYDLYEHIRRTERASNQRTAALDQLAARMRTVGRDAQFDPVEVSTWFHNGTDALRVIALNLMLVREECRDFLAALEAIDRPHSLFEQYYGLLLGREMLPRLDTLERRLLADAITRARRRRRFRRDRPLTELSNTILAELDNKI